jgi:hypothetical protein
LAEYAWHVAGDAMMQEIDEEGRRIREADREQVEP